MAMLSTAQRPSPCPNEHGFPVGSYRKSFESNLKVWEKQAETLPIPYAPNVTMGVGPIPSYGAIG